MENGRAFYSNQVEILYLHLKQALFSEKTTPFTKRMIIVPSPAMKSWLMLRMAEDPNLGVCAGLLISHLDKTVQTLQELLAKPIPTKGPSYAPNSLELSLAIETELLKKIRVYPDMDTAEKSIWEPVLHYLQVSDLKHFLSRRNQKRLLTLSERLAYLFQQYGTYGERLVSSWQESPLKQWQALLWQSLYEKNPFWTVPFDLLSLEQLDLGQKKNVQVHLFALSFIPRIYHNCLAGIARAVQVYYYVLSPCQAFWTDIRSDRERRNIVKRWQESGIAENQLQDLETYLRDNNPLLANFGKLGREMAAQLQEQALPSEEFYLLPADAAHLASYEDLVADDLIVIEKNAPLSMLEAVQADLVLLRNPAVTEPVEISADDRTIQIHAAPSPYREVEILYHVLAGIIDKHSKENDPILPKDILVMAPDISAYAPFIKAIFQSKDSLFDAQITDLSMAAQNPLAQTFLLLLNLAASRWDAVSLVELIEMPPFQKKQQLSFEELSTWHEWIKSAAIRWGENSEHREELFIREYGAGGLMGAGGAGTWENGLDRLITGMTTTLLSDEFAPAEMQTIPVEGVSYTQAPLLEKWIRILRSLREDLQPLYDGTALTGVQWASYLRCLCEAYLSPDFDDVESINQYASLLQQIDRLKQAARSLPEETFRYESIGPRLEQLLHEERVTYRETSLQAVRFCSLLPMRALPAKVIVWMGMEEGAFPRQDIKDSLNLLLGSPLADYAPTTIDFDRYLFLEALISARRYFLATYSKLSSEANGEKSPSLLIEELLSYMDKAYTKNGQPGSFGCQITHPFYGFDAKYFTSNALVSCYSTSTYKEALAYYHKNKELPHIFIPDFSAGEAVLPVEGTIRLDLKQLRALAKDPIKTYLNKNLGIYLDNPEDLEIQAEESAFLSHLELHQLRQGGLRMPIKDVLRHAEKTGLLPSGQFKQIAERTVEQDVEEIIWKLKEQGVAWQDVRSIVFAEDCQEPILDAKGNWRVPALSLRYREKASVILTGKFSHVCSEGLLLREEDKFEGHLKVWPEFLLFAHLLDVYPLPIARQLILYKKKVAKKEAFFSSTEDLLRQYLDYYFTGLQYCSPLLPEWASVLVDPEKSFAEKVQQDVQGEHTFLHEYAKWVFVNLTAERDLGVKDWSQLAGEYFGPIKESWSGKGRKKC